jgi:tripartite-type tricarboxylate transporter receptor subunit TctC
MRISARRAAVAAAFALVALPGLAQEAPKAKTAAEQFPAGRPIEMVTLFGAPSASTQTARVLADGMAKVLGAPVLIVDKPGAGGALGYMHTSRQKPDGYTLVWASNSISTTHHLGQLEFDYKNFDHVAQVTIENAALAVRTDSPWKTLKELIDYAKANPDKVRVGNSGQGSHTHVASVALFMSAGAKIVPVHRTGGQATADLLGGRVEAIAQFPQVVAPHVKDGKFRVLALLGTVPDPAFPDVKSAKAQGYGVALDLWRGISVPKGTPKAVIAKLQDAIKKTVESAEFQEAGKKIFFTPAYLPSAAFTKMIAEDDARIAAVVKEIKELEKNAPKEPEKAPAAAKEPEKAPAAPSAAPADSESKK